MITGTCITATKARDILSPAVPQTYGEAVLEYGTDVITCEPHEWDNRTTRENARYLLGRLATKFNLNGEGSKTQ